MWSKGAWIEDWTNYVFISLHKKASTSLCENHKTIALMSHASKVFLSILYERRLYYLNDQIPRELVGSLKNKNTGKEIIIVRLLVEKIRKYIYLCQCAFWITTSLPTASVGKDNGRSWKKSESWHMHSPDFETSGGVREV